ncbi:MAG: hypothetical protein GY715_16670 [Planctomycetes bacterium]|nr:hypothetical protein [Planctomycetota bacterium]
MWMTAGLLSYKLCDRDFDCEHCPLDCALRGGVTKTPPFARLTVESEPEVDLFPDDRLYTLGHTWLEPSRDGSAMRFGLDRFATSLIGRPRRLRWRSSPRLLVQRATVCELELDEGVIRIGTPIVARPEHRNPRLQEDPGAIVDAPYGSGWIIELAPLGRDNLEELISPREALEQARLDLKCLRRRIAHHLLADTAPGPEILANGAASLADLRLMLGPAVYLDLVRELIR